MKIQINQLIEMVSIVGDYVYGMWGNNEGINNNIFMIKCLLTPSRNKNCAFCWVKLEYLYN